MISKINYSILKYFIFTSLILGLVSNVHAQDARRDNFFADIKSIDLAVDLNGDFNFCKIRESDIRSAVGYTLANSPLRKIDKDALDFLSINLIVLNAENDRGVSLGCSVALRFELRRSTIFRSSFNYVTVWRKGYLQLGTENSISGQVNALIEKTTKEFVAKWAEQN